MKLFPDKSKFKQTAEDPTPTRLATLRSYLKQLNKRGKLYDIFKKIRPQNARMARANGLPKVHKYFDNIPPFRATVDTAGTTHCSVGKYLSELLNTLTQKEYSL